MKREEEIQQKAQELAQQCFPNEYNIWARPNYEAQAVKAACMEMCKWADSTMLDAACDYLESVEIDRYLNATGSHPDFDYERFVNDFRQAMQDV